MASVAQVEILRDVWYMAASGWQLKRGQILGKKLLNTPMLLGRDASGEVFAMRDICPHRGIPLSHGKFDGHEIECCYHGWRFNCEGTCTHIPSLLPNQMFDLTRVRVGRFPCREVQGNIWVFMPENELQLPDPLPEVPFIPDVDASHYRMVETSLYPCSIDHAVCGLMDPAHGPFVHQSWWWRTRKSIHQKSKEYAPSHWGFSMVRHKPSSNSQVYKLFGEVTTEIRFELPSTRIEHIIAGRHRIVSMTIMTLLTDSEVELHQVFYWTFGWLSLWMPLPAMAWCGRILTWGLLAWAWRRLSAALAPGVLYAVLSAALFVTLNSRLSIAGEWIVRDDAGAGSG